MMSPKGMKAEYSNCSVTSWSKPPAHRKITNPPVRGDGVGDSYAVVLNVHTNEDSRLAIRIDRHYDNTFLTQRVAAEGTAKLLGNQRAAKPPSRHPSLLHLFTPQPCLDRRPQATDEIDPHIVI